MVKGSLVLFRNLSTNSDVENKKDLPSMLRSACSEVDRPNATAEELWIKGESKTIVMSSFILHAYPTRNITN